MQVSWRSYESTSVQHYGMDSRTASSGKSPVAQPPYPVTPRLLRKAPFVDDFSGTCTNLAASIDRSKKSSLYFISSYTYTFTVNDPAYANISPMAYATIPSPFADDFSGTCTNLEACIDCCKKSSLYFISSYTCTFTFNDPENAKECTPSIIERPHPLELRLHLSFGSTHTCVDVLLPTMVNVSSAKIQISRKKGFIRMLLPLVEPSKDSDSKSCYGMFGMPRVMLDAMPIIDVEVGYQRLDWAITLTGAQVRHDAVFTLAGAQISAGERTSSQDMSSSALTSFKETIHAVLHHYVAFSLASPGMGVEFIVFINALRLDFNKGSVVLDAAVCALNPGCLDEVTKWFHTPHFSQDPTEDAVVVAVNITKEESALWKRVFPGLCERARNTYEHAPDCGYGAGGGSGSIPLSPTDVPGRPLFCGCCMGKDLEGTEFLKAARHPQGGGWKKVVDSFGVRVALLELLYEAETIEVGNSPPRLWLRPTQSHSHEPSSFYLNGSEAVFQGTCSAATASSPVSDQFNMGLGWVCQACEAACHVMEGHMMPECCPAASADPEACLQEDLSQRVMVDVAEAWLGEMACASLASSDGGGGGGGGGTWTCRSSSVSVHLTDDLATKLLSIGDVVQVVGFPRIQQSSQAGSTTSAFQQSSTSVQKSALGSILFHAVNLQPAAAHAPWLICDSRPNIPPPLLSTKTSTTTTTASTSSLGLRLQPTDWGCFPLQTLCDSLMAVLGTYVPLEICIAILVSAASVSTTACTSGSTGSKGSPVVAPHREGGSVSVLFVQDAFDTSLISHILRPASEILCPHSLCLTSHMEEPIMPKLQTMAACTNQDGVSSQLLSTSVLTSANQGLLIIDAPVMGTAAASQRLKAQLSKALGSSKATVAPVGGRGMHGSAGAVSVPVTATVWGVSHDLSGGRLDLGGDEGRGGRGGGARAKPPLSAQLDPEGFSLVLAYCPDEQLQLSRTLEAAQVAPLWSDAGSSILPSEQGTMQGTVQGQVQGGSRRLESGSQDGRSSPDIGACEALVLQLRHHIACAVQTSPGPRVGEAAQGFLMRYFVTVRQSTAGEGKVISHAQVIPSLLRVAQGVARLLQREGEVAEFPDCTIAVLLTEASLIKRLGRSEYHNVGMPIVALSCHTSLEMQLRSLHKTISSYFESATSVMDMQPF
eukprot:gene10246-8164_t